MADKEVALGALLITISDLCDAAETHGIVENPPAEVLAPLVEEARQFDIEFDGTPSLEALHLAVEAAAQEAAGSTD